MSDEHTPPTEDGTPAADTDTSVRAVRTRSRTRTGGRSAPAGDAATSNGVVPDSPTDTADGDSAGEDGTVQKRRTRPRSGGRAGRTVSAPAATAPADAEVGQAPDGQDDEVVLGAVKVPGAVDEPELDVEAEPADAQVAAALVRRRRRRRVDVAPGVEPEGAAEGPALDTPDAANLTVEAAAPGDGPGAADAEAVASDPGDTDGETGGDGQRPARRRRRGGRGRGRRGRGRSAAQAEGEPVPETAETSEPGDEEAVAPAPAPAEVAPPTRLAARGRSRNGRERSGGGQRGRRSVGTVSEETRRAIAEGPPKRMLVTVGKQRTQIVVLEERNLVEHYVTRRQDVSYVGNIYMGRVQNVLPGMEAAFVDIGKGRNGVLYAGEVNYDEADLEGDLPRIEQTLKPGQTVLVQVTKDPMGTKGARLTQHLSIAGRYCVLAPSDAMLGISRKLPDDERERLRKILKVIKPEDYGLIVRTAAEGATREQLEDDVTRLVRIWEQVQERATDAKALEPVYEEPELVIRVIRDVFGADFSDLILDDEGLAEQVKAYLADVSPELVDRVSVHRGDEALFDGYEVTNQIRRALEKKVWLQSGGYLIVEKTEAMWVIDVNTGKFVGRSNLEETVLRNNLEAAEEIARQLRLRDMGGIIVIDFVDMLVPANRDEVLKRFKRELARDKTKSRVMEISKLGLVQMTRKNVSQGLNESFTVTCDCCEGRGAQIVPSMLD